MADWWVPLISAGAALGGVWLTSTLGRRRAQEDRYAEIEKECRVELLAWARDAEPLMWSTVKVLMAGAPMPEMPILDSKIAAQSLIYLRDSIATDRVDQLDRDLRALNNAELSTDEHIHHAVQAQAAIGEIQGYLTAHRMFSDPTIWESLMRWFRRLRRRLGLGR